ncbi:MAG TPA: hypothetical protein VLH13_03860 [Methanomassiliicoccales archaeon]|nr:hypothetical protein [Methanomassiliicoccales archaeon]
MKALEPGWERKERMHDERLLRMAVSLTKEREPYSWIGLGEGFGLRLVDELIDRCPAAPKNILDPFAGSGTTLWAAGRRGIPARGLEIMPMCALRFEGMLSWNDMDLEMAASLADDLLALAPDEEFHPPGHGLGLLQEDASLASSWRSFLQKVPSAPERGLLQTTALLALRDREMSIISYRGHDKRTGRKAKLGRIPRGDDLSSAFRMRMTKALLHLTMRGNDAARMKGQELECASALRALPGFKSSSYDCVITSPPYYNGFDYLQNYALEHWFLGLDEELRLARSDIFPTGPGNGMRAEQVRKACLASKGRAFHEVERALQNMGADLRSAMHIFPEEEAVPFHSYMLAQALVLSDLARIVRPGGSIFYVIDDAYVSDADVPLGDIFSELAARLGLNIKGIYRDLRENEEMGRLSAERKRTAVCHWVR